MKKPISENELKMAIEIRKKTGKKLRTCIFCIRYRHGDYQKALELCSSSAKEGGRRSLYYNLV